MGEIAALAVAFCWSLTSIQFTLASQRIGTGAVNRTRLVLAMVYLSFAHLLLYGELWPSHYDPYDSLGVPRKDQPALNYGHGRCPCGCSYDFPDIGGCQ